MAQPKQELQSNVYRERCEKDVVYFFETFVKIKDSIKCQAISWGAWQYLIDLLHIFEEENEIVILKARQLGISWLVAGYALWTVLFKENALVLMFSKGERESWELVDKCKFIYNNLPSYLKIDLTNERRDGLAFTNSSAIKALPSTQNAGVGETATLVIRDELAFHPYAEENFFAVGPTVDAGGKMIDLSTRNINTSDDHFINRYTKAKTSESTAKAVFLGWKERPVRRDGMSLDDWYNNVIKQKYSLYEVEKNYPESEEQALSPVKGLAYFDPVSLDFMRRDCYDPIEKDETVSIWCKPEFGTQYCAFIDPSDGGGDPHAAGWMDIKSGRIVAISHGKLKAEECAVVFDKYCRYYNNAYNEFELNLDIGKRVNEVLSRLQTPNRRLTTPSKDRANKYGWWTGGNMNASKNVRMNMLAGLEEAVRNRRIRLHYGEAVNELEAMMRLEGEQPKVPRGKHDDLIMMLAGLWAISKDVQSNTLSTHRGAGRCSGF